MSAEFHTAYHLDRLGPWGAWLFESLLPFQTDGYGRVAGGQLLSSRKLQEFSGFANFTVRTELSRCHHLDYLVVEGFERQGYRIWIANPFPLSGTFVRKEHARRCLQTPGGHALLCLGLNEAPPSGLRWLANPAYPAPPAPLEFRPAAGPKSPSSTRTRGDPAALRRSAHCATLERTVRYDVAQRVSVKSLPCNEVTSLASSPRKSREESQKNRFLRTQGNDEAVALSPTEARHAAPRFAKPGPAEAIASARAEAHRLLRPVLREFPGLTPLARRQAIQAAIEVAGGEASGVGPEALTCAFRHALAAIERYQREAGRPGVRLTGTFYALVRRVIPGEAMRYNAARAEAVHDARKRDDRELAREFMARVDRLVEAGLPYDEACVAAATAAVEDATPHS